MGGVHYLYRGSGVADVRILVIDDDQASQRALRFILDAEGWSIEVVALPDDALAKLARGGWNLVIANVSMSSLSGPLFNLLQELAEAKGSLRVLFLVPAIAEARARQVLEKLKLPYETKPLHLHEFLERVGDLLLEAGAIQQPLRRVRHGLAQTERRLQDRRKQQKGGPEMFACRADYYDFDEEELRKYEEEERRKKQETPGEPDSQ